MNDCEFLQINLEEIPPDKFRWYFPNEMSEIIPR